MQTIQQKGSIKTKIAAAGTGYVGLSIAVFLAQHHEVATVDIISEKVDLNNNRKSPILIGCLCSIATEATQYLLKMGWCETDDVIHNTLGTAIGVWVWLWQSKRLKTVADQKSDQD